MQVCVSNEATVGGICFETTLTVQAVRATHCEAGTNMPRSDGLVEQLTSCLPLSKIAVEVPTGTVMRQGLGLTPSGRCVMGPGKCLTSARKHVKGSG